jgi:hypothetical protein
MANPAVTYTFSNSTTADATQVNQNFTDLINSLTDATKSLSIDALTVGGAATLNGAVTLGNASSDDITFTGSLASTLPIKTTNSFNIGSSTLGLAGIYLGANSQTVRVVGSSSMSATWTLTLPVTAGTDKYVLETNGSGVTSWALNRIGAMDVKNVGLSATVGSNEMTITLLGADGNALSATNYVSGGFRSTTAATGTVTSRSATSALTLVIPNTATLGTTSAVEAKYNVYLIDNAGTLELAVSNLGATSTDGRITTLGIDTAADSATAFYSTTARSNVACKLIGCIVHTQATAGTYATSPSAILMAGCGSVFSPAMTDWVSYTLTIGGTTSAPTPGAGASSSARWRRVGDSMEIQYRYSQTSGGSNGSGTYLFPLPSGYTMDTNKMSTTTSGTGTDGTLLGQANFSSTTSAASTDAASGFVVAHNSTNLSLRAATVVIDTMQGISSSFFQLSTTTIHYQINAKVPIVGWFYKDWQLG